MKIVGIIAEYNPFHNGHEYQIKEARRLTDADYVVVVMSGDFVQRGTPAIADKYIRTAMALSAGADAVFELPACYATASAEFFAEGAITILDCLGGIEFLCFGSESGNIKEIQAASEFFRNEPNDYKENLRIGLKNGETFPEARKNAYLKAVPDSNRSVLDTPNNLLGIEYGKALLKRSSKIIPVTIQRAGASFHDQGLSDRFSSATAIRCILEQALAQDKVNKDDLIRSIENHVPCNVFKIITEEFGHSFPIRSDDLSFILHYKMMTESKERLYSYLDINEDLANRILRHHNNTLTFNEFALQIKTKQMTLTRIQRALLHMILQIRTQDMNQFRLKPEVCYARLLGMQESASPLLRHLKKTSKIPIITKLGTASKQLAPISLQMLNTDLLASSLYRQLIFQKFGKTVRDEYSRGIVRHSNHSSKVF